MHLEQTGNISLVTRQGAGLMLSKWDLNRRSLGCALEHLLSDSALRDNMLRLKALQDQVDVPANAAREIMRFPRSNKMNRSLRITIVFLGAYAGLLAMQHGIFAMLPGSGAPKPSPAPASWACCRLAYPPEQHLDSH